MDLSLITTEADGHTVLAVSGDIDLSTVPNLRARLIEIVSSGTTSFVIDLSSVQFIDSTGLGVLVGAQRRLRAVDGQLTLIVPDGQMRSLFHVTGLDRVLTIVDGVEGGQT